MASNNQSGKRVFVTDGSITTNEVDSLGRTLSRSVFSVDGGVIITSETRSADNSTTFGESSITVPSEAVSNAIYAAVEATFRAGDKFTTAEATQLDRLRQDVARFAVDDGQFDPSETAQILARVKRIQRGIE